MLHTQCREFESLHSYQEIKESTMSTLTTILHSNIDIFSLKRALCLSDKILEMEANGEELTDIENHLWERLTVKIELAREYPNFSHEY